MAADSNTVIARVGLDDNGFQEGVSRIQRSLKVVQSEFVAASSKLGDFGKSTEGLRLKSDTLNKQLELQSDKVSALTRSYEESVAQKGADAKATENLKIKLNYATAELGKMQSELKQTTSELNLKSSAWYKLSQSMDKAGEKMKAVGEKISSVGTKLSAAVTLPILGIGTAATKMAMDAVESENLFEVAMGAMAGDARKWSEETSKSLGLNSYNVRKNVATYNAMLTSMGLMADEIVNGAGNKKWWDSTITKMLRNEKYMGDVMLQKTYTVDFLTKKRVKNDGYVQKYYIEDNHEPIISKEMFAAVQAEFIRRTNLRGYSITGKSKFTSTSPFSGKLFCNACGSKFVRHSWGTGKHKQPVWICINHQMNGDEACSQKAVKERALEKAFVRAMTSLIGDKDGFIEKLLENIYKGLDLQPHNFNMRQLDERLSQLQQELVGLVKINAKTGFDTTAYDKEYEVLATEMEELRANRQGLIDEDAAKALRVQRSEELKEYITTQETALTKFDEDLFRRIIEKVSVRSLVEVTFVFKTGVEVKELLE